MSLRPLEEARRLRPVLAGFELRDGYAQERSGGLQPVLVRRARIKLRASKPPGAAAWHPARGQLQLTPTPSGRLAFFGELDSPLGTRRISRGEHLLRVEAEGFGPVDSPLDLDQAPIGQRLVLPPGPDYPDLDPPGTPRLLLGVLGREAGLPDEDRAANADVLAELLRDDDEPRWLAVPVRGALRLSSGEDPTNLVVRTARPPFLEAAVAANGQWLLPGLVPPAGASLALQVHRRLGSEREHLFDLGDLIVDPGRPAVLPARALRGRLTVPRGASPSGFSVVADGLATDRSDASGRWTLALPDDASVEALRLRVTSRDGRLLHQRLHPMPQRGSTAEPPPLLIEIDPQGA